MILSLCFYFLSFSYTSHKNRPRGRPVIQKYHPDMEMVGNMAFELTGKRSPGELSGEEARQVAAALQARLQQ